MECYACEEDKMNTMVSAILGREGINEINKQSVEYENTKSEILTAKLMVVRYAKYTDKFRDLPIIIEWDNLGE